MATKEEIKRNILRELLSKAGKSTYNKYGSAHYKRLQKKSVIIRKLNKKNVDK